MDNTVYDEIFKKYADQYGLDFEQLKAQVAGAENKPLDPHAVSKAGAVGLAQIMPDTFNEWAQKLGIQNPNPFDPVQSVHVQAAYMKWLQDQTGSWMQALAAYDWGIGHLERLIRRVGEEDWMGHLPKETRDYLDRVVKYLTGN